VGVTHFDDIRQKGIGQFEVAEETIPLLRFAPPRSEVDLINTQRTARHIFRAARLHPGGVGPAITAQVVDEGGGLLAMLAKKGKRITFQENRATSGADLKFVVRVFTDTGNEQFPNAAADQLAHGVNPAIPTIEIPNYTDALGVRRPDREVNASVVTDLAKMRTEFVVKAPMLAFGKKMNVHFAHDHAIGIGVTGDLFTAIPPFDLQGVRNITRAFLESGLKKAFTLNFLRWNNGTIVVEFDRNLARVGAKNADQNVVTQSMRPEDAKRIRVRALQKRAQLIGHEDGNIESFHQRKGHLRAYR